jgi:hypothetical protein
MTRALPLAAALLAFALSLAAAPGARAAPVSETAELGDVRATFSYAGKDFAFHDLHLTIVRAGVTAFDAPITYGSCRGDSCLAPARPGDGSSVRVLDLDGDGEPEVLLDVYTGGAHCCTIALVYRYDAAAGAYRRRAHNFLDPGYRLADLDRDGTLELLSADGRFAYAFTAFAMSAFPVQVWRFTGGRFRDVTNSLRSRVERDARGLLRTYRSLRARRGDVRGVLAAYTADLYRLGRSADAWRLVRAAIRRGELPARGDGMGPSARGYERALRRFLIRTGYARR